MGSLAAETGTAEAQLFERHSDLVYRYCLRMLGSREDAEDAAQTTFFQALRALRRGVTPTFEQAWLLTIAKNECKSRYRSGSRRRQRELAHDPQTLAEFAQAAPNGGDGRLIGVRTALSRLPETQRRALLLREWQGRSYAEIAHELGVSRPAVEALIFRARRGLARELGEETRERRHALDLASVLGSLKSLLGGGAAVKLAAGVAAVATVGVVAGGTGRGPAPVVPLRHVGAKTPPVEAKAPNRAEAATVVTRHSGLREDAKVLSGGRRGAVTRSAKPVSAGPVTGEAAPRVDQSAPSTPQPTPVQEPASPPPVQAPALPEVPSVPAAPPPPPLPTGELPKLPEVLPEVPQVQVPDVPALPDAPALPEVPDLPIVGDVPSLP